MTTSHLSGPWLLPVSKLREAKMSTHVATSHFRLTVDGHVHCIIRLERQAAIKPLHFTSLCSEGGESNMKGFIGFLPFKPNSAVDPPISCLS